MVSTAPPSRVLHQPPAGVVIDYGNPLARGLILAEHFLEGGGRTTKDGGPYGAVGTLGTAVKWKGADALGTALNFPNDATNGFITLPSVSALNAIPTYLTVAFWAKRAAIGANQALIGVEKWSVIYTSANKVNFLKPGISDNLSTGTVADTNWHHVVAVKNGDGANGLLFYIDAKTAGTASPGSVVVSTTAPWIAKEPGFNIPFNGDIAMLQVWNRALSYREVRELYNMPYTLLKRPPLPFLNIRIPSPPGVTTSAATSVTWTTATLNGSIETNGSSTTVTFEYGLNSDLSAPVTTVTAAESPLADSGSPQTVTKALTGLIPSTTYYFRAIGTNVDGTTNGSILNFTTTADVELVAISAEIQTLTISPIIAVETLGIAPAASVSAISIATGAEVN